jgi:hypothetical protein
MPLANRVTPFGELIAHPARGTLFGNRGGRFHDPAARTLGRRRWASKQWICCVLEFKERHRRVWGMSYTELFFCDEVTALAAGHRPCVECRRADAHAFRAAVIKGLELPAPPRFPEIDRHLHAERLIGRQKRLHRLQAEMLPDGAMLAIDDAAFAIRGSEMLPWSPSGYAAPRPRAKGEVDALTPPLTLAALRAGYAPRWHATAPQSAGGNRSGSSGFLSRTSEG